MVTDRGEHSIHYLCVYMLTSLLYRPVLTLEKLDPDTGISNKAMAILNSFVNDILERIVLRQVRPRDLQQGYGHPQLVCQRYLRAHRSSFATPSRPFCSLWLLYTVLYCLPILHHFAPAQSVSPFCSLWLLHAVLYCLPILHYFAMLRVCPIPEWAIIPHPRSDDSRRYFRAHLCTLTDRHLQWATAILNSFVNDIFERIGLSVNATDED
ncbi:hypothetical protein P692DRAFT_20881830 [Suillus brevipes Sb2]|nr:hypothetical protein P692DRAFT_20881830 [Suillus brevipes Sb2]